jgi:hypothetical protein
MSFKNLEVVKKIRGEVARWSRSSLLASPENMLRDK